MLILSRRPDEDVVIDIPKNVDASRVKIKLLSISGRQIRVGITAPAEIGVHRGEIMDKIDAGDTSGDNSVRRPKLTLQGEAPVVET